jgi:hypothetical protein
MEVTAAVATMVAALVAALFQPELPSMGRIRRLRVMAMSRLSSASKK